MSRAELFQPLPATSRAVRTAPRRTCCASGANRRPSRRCSARGRRLRVRVLGGTADRERTSRDPPTCSRARSRTACAGTRRCAGSAWIGRRAGTRTACRWSSRSRRNSASAESRRSRSTESARFNAQCRESGVDVQERVGGAVRAHGVLARLLPSVRHVRERIHRVGLEPAGAVSRKGPRLPRKTRAPVLRTLRHRTLLARARATGRLPRT